MPEPQSHFQLSFTSRQALALFVGLLLALGVAYFLGVMTGLSGREATESAPAPVPTAEPTEAPAETPAETPSPTVPARRTQVPGVWFPKPVLGAEPTTSPNLQLFEDRGGEEPTPPKRVAQPTAALTPPPSGEFWVQVLSLSSAKEAKTASDRLSRRGHHVAISQAPGPKGTVYRVRVGPFRSRDQAAKVAEQLSREEKVQTWVVPAGK